MICLHPSSPKNPLLMIYRSLACSAVRMGTKIVSQDFGGHVHQHFLKERQGDHKESPLKTVDLF